MDYASWHAQPAQPPDKKVKIDTSKNEYAESAAAGFDAGPNPKSKSEDEGFYAGFCFGGGFDHPIDVRSNTFQYNLPPKMTYLILIRLRIT